MDSQRIARNLCQSTASQYQVHRDHEPAVSAMLRQSRIPVRMLAHMEPILGSCWQRNIEVREASVGYGRVPNPMNMDVWLQYTLKGSPGAGQDDCKKYFRFDGDR